MTSSSIEVLFEGPKEIAKAFVIAFLRGRGTTDPVVDLEHEGFDCESVMERIGEFLRPGHNVSHLLVSAADLPAVRDAVGEANTQEIETRILRERSLAEARFEYEVRVFAPDLAARIRAVFAALPPGVVLEPDEEFEERRSEDEDAGGMYARVHRFEFHGSGTVRGEPFGVVRFRRTCLEEPAIVAREARVIRRGTSS
jgi:hypothetical protein